MAQPGSTVTIDGIDYLIEEYGYAFEFEGPRNKESYEYQSLVRTATALLERHYDQTKEDLEDVEIYGSFTLLRGPELLSYEEYDEFGHGVGEPKQDMVRYQFGWHALGRRRIG